MSNSRTLFTSLYATGSAICNVSAYIASPVTRNILGDALYAYWNPEGMLEELHRRSRADGTNIGIAHLGPSWQNWLPKMIYVSHEDPYYFQKIAGYGESETDPDPAARKPFDVVETLLGQKTINNLQGREAMQQKALIKLHLNLPEKYQEIYQCAGEELRQIFENSRENLPAYESYPVQINLLVNTILARCVFGIRTRLQPRHIIETMQIARLITNPWPSQSDLLHAHTLLQGISDELLNNSVAAIEPGKYIYAHADLDACASEQDKLEKLKRENIAGSLLAGTNLADLIMKTLVELSRNDKVRERMIAELDKAGDNFASLRVLPYLDLVYHEAMRLYAPSYIARRTSKLFTLLIRDNAGHERTTIVPSGSYLFAPIRPRHMDPGFWPDPERFDPDRFAGAEGPAKKRLLMTFSDGIRSCPAKFGFTEVAFKSVIALFFRQYLGLQLDKEVESIPVFNINTSWEKECYITALALRRGDDSNRSKSMNYSF